MGRVQAILFDIGGVLLTNGWDTSDRAVVFERFQLDNAEYEARHALSYNDWDCGRITADQYLDTTFFWKPQSFSRVEIINAIKGESRLLPNTALPVLQQLAAEGRYLLGYLNNESRELNDYRMATYGLRPYCSLFLCSGYVRLHKPDPAIYRLAVDLLQLPAAEIIFIDDRIVNIEAAETVGLNSILYTGPEALHEELKRRGVEFENRASE